MPAPGTARVTTKQRLKVAALRAEGMPATQIAKHVGLSPRTVPEVAADARTKSMMWRIGLKQESEIQALISACLAKVRATMDTCKTPAQVIEVANGVISIAERYEAAGRAVLQLEAQANQQQQPGFGLPDSSGAGGGQFSEVIVALRQKLAPTQPAAPTGQVIDAPGGSSGA